MKTTTKNLAITLLTIITLMTLIVPGIVSALPVAQTSAPAANTSPEISTTEKQCLADSLATVGMELSCDEYATYKQEVQCQSAYKMSCSEYVKKNGTPAEKAAADKTATEESACINASRDRFGSELSCAEYNAKLEEECTAAGYKSCAEKAIAQKNIQGAGFKLNLDALTLTSGGQKSGLSIFANKDYAKYGVIVGTLLRVMDILIMLIGSLAMLTLIIAGLFMITNHGDEAWVTKGKTMMLYSILGVLIALLSFAIVNIIQSALA